MSIRHHSLTLPDGRRLACTDMGSDTDTPVLYLHGNPGSRLEIVNPGYATEFRNAGLRVISVDRPGYGESSKPLQTGHQHLADDIRLLLESLRISRITVIGYSRGTLPALALAVQLPRLVASVGLFGATGLPDDPHLLASKAPAARLLLTLVKHAPSAAKGIFRSNALMDRVSPTTRVSRLKAGLPSRYDRALLALEGERIADAHREGILSDPDWVVEDWRSWLVHPLGFRPESVACPLHIWMGEDDQTCPVINAQRLAQRIPHSMFYRVPRTGHLHTPGILSALMRDVVASAGLAASSRAVQTGTAHAG